MDYSKFMLPFLFILLSLLSACGNQNNNTVPTEIRILKGDVALSLANGAGGVVLYGKNDHGDVFGRIIDPNGPGTIGLDLRVGNWEFYSFAWVGPGVFKGMVRCSYSTANLNTDIAEVGVTVNLTNANCTHPKFSPFVNNSGTVSFPVVKLISCRRPLSSITPSYAGTECDDSNTDSYKGPFVSYKISLFGYDGNMGNFMQGGAEISTCVTAASLSSTTGAAISLTSGGAINLPIGGSGVPIPTRVTAYYGTNDCDATTGIRGAKEFHFFGGLNSHAPSGYNDTLNYPNTGSGAAISLYLHSSDIETCAAGRAWATPFAAGTGAIGTPYILCTPTQFNTIANTYYTNSFRLASDIDFGWGAFTPIGGSNSFSGNFYGADHTIRNSKTTITTTNAGLFNRAGGANVVLINNLNLEDITVNGATTSAILFGDGSAAASNPVIVQDVNMKRIFAYGGVYTGAVVGYSGKLQLKNVHVDGKVISTASYVGGLIGYAYGVNNTPLISQSDFYGKVFSPNGYYVGGLVGRTNTGGTNPIEQARFEGSIEGSSNVGGIVGQSDGANVTDSYVKGSVIASGTAGGIFGISAAGTPTITRTFFSGGTIVGASSGGAAGSGSISCTNVYHTTTANAGACSPTQMTLANMYTNSSLTGFTIGTTTSGIWMKASGDDTYDYPRLSWELALENDRPYLKRECSGHYGSTYGAGTTVDPQWICTPAQFLAMNSSPGNYILKRDIDFYQSSAYASTSAISSANFNLDGNDYSVVNLKLTPGAGNFNGTDCNMGVFGTISSGKTIENLVLSGVEVNLSYNGIYGNGYCWNSTGPVMIPMKVGILAGINHGTVSNVSTKKSTISYSLSTSTPNSTSQHDYFGGLVGHNDGSGAMITASKIDTELALGMTINSDSNDEIDIGGVAGVNANSANINKTFSKSRIVKFSGSLYYNTFIGGIAGINDTSASIYETASEGDLVVNPSSSGPAMYLNIGGIVGFNNSSVSNSYVRTSFDLNANNFNTNYIGGIVGYNHTAGAITKVYYSKGFSDNTINVGIARKGIAGGYGGASISNAFCVDTTVNSSYGFTTGSGTPTGTSTGGIDVNTLSCLTSTPTYTLSGGSLNVNSGNNYEYTTWSLTDNWLNRFSSGAVWIFDSGAAINPVNLIYASDH